MSQPTANHRLLIQQLVDEFLHESELAVSSEFPCPYLPDRVARNQWLAVKDLPGSVYRAFMDRGFRRSGRVIYRPQCRGCNECRPLRIPVTDFTMSRSQRRVWRRNHDVHVTVADTVQPDRQKWDLFLQYLNHQHDGMMAREYNDFVDFLYDSPTDTLEFIYRIEGRLAGISIADRFDEGLSSVYMFFDPALARRSLGTFSVLWEIDHCRRSNWRYYYLGYHVRHSPAMQYKARFRPNELLDDSLHWSIPADTRRS